MNELMESRQWERLVIGCWLMGGAEVVRQAPMGLDELDGGWGHAHIVRAVLGRAGRGEPIDAALVLADLQAAGVHERVGDVGARGAALYLHACISEVPSVASAGFYAQEVRRRALRRRLDVHAERMHHVVTTSGEHDDVLDLVAREATAALAAVDVTEEDSGALESTWTLGEYLARERRPHRWVIPDVCKAQDVWMFLGGEGSGKSVVGRQQLLCAAAGVHPFRRNENTLRQEFIPPARSLLVDLEVADDTLQEELEWMVESLAHVADGVEGADFEGAYDRMKVWHRPRGVDLREPRDVRELEKRIADHRPQVLAIGPVYKMFQAKRGDTSDTGPLEVVRVLDELRERYDLALWMEHHTPKAVNEKGQRDATPYGSNVWMKWPSHGRTMRRIHPDADIFELVPFRGDRGKRPGVPVAIGHGLSRRELPWRPYWDAAEVNGIREEYEQANPQ